MPTFAYKKLVRDNIPGWHVKNGHTVRGRQLEGEELKVSLCQKLHEEADEVSGALSREELIEELADVQQVLRDLCEAQGIAFSEVQAAMEQKAARKGGFSQGEYIDTVTIPDEHDKWAQYCRASPDKYPEVSIND